MSRKHCIPYECSDSSEEDYGKCRRILTDKQKIKILKRDVKDLKLTISKLEKKVENLTNIIDEMIKYQPDSKTVKELEAQFYQKANQ